MIDDDLTTILASTLSALVAIIVIIALSILRYKKKSFGLSDKIMQKKPKMEVDQNSAALSEGSKSQSRESKIRVSVLDDGIGNTDTLETGGQINDGNKKKYKNNNDDDRDVSSTGDAMYDYLSAGGMGQGINNIKYHMHTNGIDEAIRGEQRGESGGELDHNGNNENDASVDDLFADNGDEGAGPLPVTTTMKPAEIDGDNQVTIKVDSQNEMELATETEDAATTEQEMEL